MYYVESWKLYDSNYFCGECHNKYSYQNTKIDKGHKLLQSDKYISYIVSGTGEMNIYKW